MKKTSTALVGVLKRIFSAKNNFQLALRLGIAQPTISNWEKGGDISERHLKKIIGIAVVNAVTPILEIQQVSPNCEKNLQGKPINSWRMDTVEKDEKLKKSLDGKAGVYLFYDSFGEVLYVGKALNLYKEIRQRLNRRVRIRVGKDALDLKSKDNIKKEGKEFQLGKITCYISAYQVLMPEARTNVEAFLIRSFANNHTNSQIANFNFES